MLANQGIEEVVVPHANEMYFHIIRERLFESTCQTARAQLAGPNGIEVVVRTVFMCQ